MRYYFISLYFLISAYFYYSPIESRVGHIIALVGILNIFLLKLEFNKTRLLQSFLGIALIISARYIAKYVQFTIPVYDIAIPLLPFVNKKDLSRIFTAFKNLLLLSAIPSIFVLILYLLNLDDSWLLRSIQIYGRKFFLYPLTWVSLDDIYKEVGLKFFRINGIYNEPGALGTIIFFTCLADNFDVSKRNTRILMFIGFMTLSLAFYILFFLNTIFNVLLKLIKKNNMNYKKIVIYFLLIVILFFTFYNVIDKFILYRLYSSDISSGKIGETRRTGTEFGEFYFFLKGLTNFELLFGQGIGQHSAVGAYIGARGSSYMSFIYDYGLLSLIILIVYMIRIMTSTGINLNKFWFIVIFLLSLYQRTQVINNLFLFLVIVSMNRNNKDDRGGDVENIKSIKKTKI